MDVEISARKIEEALVFYVDYDKRKSQLTFCLDSADLDCVYSQSTILGFKVREILRLQFENITSLELSNSSFLFSNFKKNQPNSAMYNCKICSTKLGWRFECEISNFTNIKFEYEKINIKQEILEYTGFENGRHIYFNRYTKNTAPLTVHVEHLRARQ